MSAAAPIRTEVLDDGTGRGTDQQPDASSWWWCGEFDARDRAPKRARAAVVAVCGKRLDDETLVDVLLVVSELVTNCVEHGGAERVRLCLRGAGSDIVVSVTSTAPIDGVPDPSDWHLPSVTSCTGRGLAMIRRIGRPDVDGPSVAADPGWSGITVAIEPHPH